MNPHVDHLLKELPKKILLAMAVLITLTIAVDSALHASHIMVFFSLIILSALFFSLYAETERHRLGVSIACLLLGSIYIAFHGVHFSWLRFSVYSAAMYLSAIVLFASWMMMKHEHHRRDKSAGRHIHP